FVDNAAAALPVVDRWAVSRAVVHHGFRTQEGVTSGSYDSAYTLVPRAAGQRGSAGVKHVVFVADGHTPLPKLALGLQASGLATIVSPDALTDVPTAAARELELPFGLIARV